MNPLEKFTGFCFFVGFTLLKLHYLPVLQTIPLLQFIAFGCYIVGYSTWIIACLRYPQLQLQQDTWYGFTQYKYQYLLTSLIGLAAIACCIVGFFFPVALSASYWLFALSHLFWFTAEYHKYKNPPSSVDKTYSSTQQEIYVNYALIVTGLSLFSAATATAALFCPAFSLTILTAAALVCLLVGLIAANYWIKSRFHPHGQDSKKPSTTTIVVESDRPIDDLSANSTLQYSTYGPFFKPPTSTPIPPPTTENSFTPNLGGSNDNH